MTTFTRTTQQEDETTGLVTPFYSTITGEAIQVKGRAETYKNLGLVESAAPTLFFTPETYGDKVMEGDTVVWADETYVAKDCYHIMPDGVVIASRVVVVK